MPPRKRLLFFLLIGLLTVAVGVIPDLVSDELKAWCLQRFGASYPWYFIGFFVVGCFALLAVSGDFKDLLPFNRQTKAQRQIKIAWSQETKHHLQSAKDKLGESQSEEAIQKLRALNNTEVDRQLLLLSARLEQHKRHNIAGTLTNEQKETGLNRIHEGIFQLIMAIEGQLAEGEKENQQLREAFRPKYRKRLSDKLASRQPVSLRRLPSTEGTSERMADTFIPYNSEEIKEEIGKTFQAAHGRLLIVGQPGAGKTTLLLQLADRLFDLEADTLPVVINLATWQSSYGKLEIWLEAVLAAELSTNKAGAKAVLRQSGLILLLDGLDELKEDEAINSCLAAIAAFGATPGRRFVITCRIEEYKRASEDARVNLQIEVGPLTGEQLEAELTRMGREQPEAIPLLQAIQKDPLLHQVIETPFYFNTLQLLFAGRLPVFRAGDSEGRKAEIKKMFVVTALQNTELKEYPSERAQHWLSFLASRMNERNKVVFELRDLQYEWWRRWSKRQLFQTNFIGGLVPTTPLLLASMLLPTFGILMFEIVSSSIITSHKIFNSLKGGALGALLGVLFIGIFHGLNGKSIRVSRPQDIYTKDWINWSIRKYLKLLKGNLIGWLYFGLLGMAVGAKIGGKFGLVTGWFIGSLLGDLIYGFVFGFLDIIETESYDFIQIKSPYQRFYASMKSLHFSILQHRHLRYLLHKKGALPLDLVDFLNEMSARHLLETDGGPGVSATGSFRSILRGSGWSRSPKVKGRPFLICSPLVSKPLKISKNKMRIFVFNLTKFKTIWF